MSRSRKKPYVTQGSGDPTRKFMKRSAAKAVRNLPEDDAPANGKAFRKFFNSWDIVDWSFHDPKNKKARRK